MTQYFSKIIFLILSKNVIMKKNVKVVFFIAMMTMISVTSCNKQNGVVEQPTVEKAKSSSLKNDGIDWKQVQSAVNKFYGKKINDLQTRTNCPRPALKGLVSLGGGWYCSGSLLTEPDNSNTFSSYLYAVDAGIRDLGNNTPRNLYAQANIGGDFSKTSIVFLNQYGVPIATTLSGFSSCPNWYETSPFIGSPTVRFILVSRNQTGNSAGCPTFEPGVVNVEIRYYIQTSDCSVIDGPCPE
jgi:hypothetical protein